VQGARPDNKCLVPGAKDDHLALGTQHLALDT
jgi:hypothetical protein